MIYTSFEYYLFKLRLQNPIAALHNLGKAAINN